MSFPEVPLKRLGRLLGGATPGADARYWDGDVTWYTPTDVARAHGGVLGGSDRDLTDAGLASCGASLMPSGSIVFTSRAPIGNAAMASREFATSQGCKSLVPKAPHDARFIVYAATVRGHQLRAAGTGATFPELSAERLGNVRFPMSPASRQRTIVDFLDQECARIAGLEGSLSALLLALAKPALARFSSLTAVQTTTTQVGHQYEVQLGKMLDEGKISEGGLVPYLRNSNVGWDRFDLSDIKEMPLTPSDRRRYAVRPGDLLACEGRHVGKSAIWDGAISPIYYQKALHRIRPHDTGSNRFLMWCLWLGSTRGDYYADASGSTIPHLPAEKLRRVRIPAVDRDTQDRIVRETDAVYLAARRAADATSRLRTTLAEYRDALITEAVAGQLDVIALSDAQMDERLHEAVESADRMSDLAAVELAPKPRP